MLFLKSTQHLKTNILNKSLHKIINGFTKHYKIHSLCFRPKKIHSCYSVPLVLQNLKKIYNFAITLTTASICESVMSSLSRNYESSLIRSQHAPRNLSLNEFTLSKIMTERTFPTKFGMKAICKSIVYFFYTINSTSTQKTINCILFK